MRQYASGSRKLKVSEGEHTMTYWTSRLYIVPEHMTDLATSRWAEARLQVAQWQAAATGAAYTHNILRRPYHP